MPHTEPPFEVRPNQLIVHKGNPQRKIAMIVSSGNVEEDQDNAEFLVRAANNYWPMMAAIASAAQRFREYERQHREQGKWEKAENNQSMAIKLEDVLFLASIET